MKLANGSTDTSRAERLFPREDKSYCYGFHDYDPIIGDMGEVLLNETHGSYQGDIFAVVKKEGKYGFFNIGYGSCSGCDVLQGMSSYTELAEYIESIERDIRWFDTAADLSTYVHSEEARYSWYAQDEEWIDFKAKVAALV
jgi:hypothetical protein